MILTDTSPMPFGKYKGDKMEHVPASYLLWLYAAKKYNTEVKEYIENNMDVLKHETRNNPELW